LPRFERIRNSQSMALVVVQAAHDVVFIYVVIKP
jgi:hypothetical protein